MTVLLFQSLALGSISLEGVIVGAVKSILMSDCVTSAEFPASSTHVAVVECDAPSVDTTSSVISVSPALTPDKSSIQEYITVTVELFQPSELAAGDLESITGVGGLSSHLNEVEFNEDDFQEIV